MVVNDSAGVNVGAPVRLDGLDVGRVEHIALAKNSGNIGRRIELTLRLDKRYQDHILSDSTATLVTEGLLGNRYVTLTDGYQGTPLEDNAEITVVPSKVIDLRDVLNSVSKIPACCKDSGKANQAHQKDSTKAQN